ncbi:DNA-processing protein DprA [Rickettsia parkeri]|uniref:DNA-processing protein DprA n=1 Tax=Rickettsia parkeri TaxID=35792 RepID=UPI002F2B8BFE
MGFTPLGKHFPQRNRIISGLALGVVVVEASLKSGSLITAKFALEQNREIFAVPGFPLDPKCQGTNKLIREGAYLVESVDDIVANLPQYEEFMKKDDGLFKDFVELGTVNTRYVKEPLQKERTACYIGIIIGSTHNRLGIFTKRNRITASYPYIR